MRKRTRALATAAAAAALIGAGTGEALAWGPTWQGATMNSDGYGHYLNYCGVKSNGASFCGWLNPGGYQSDPTTDVNYLPLAAGWHERIQWYGGNGTYNYQYTGDYKGPANITIYNGEMAKVTYIWYTG
jgi:hypothetical protein